MPENSTPRSGLHPLQAPHAKSNSMFSRSSTESSIREKDKAQPDRSELSSDNDEHRDSLSDHDELRNTSADVEKGDTSTTSSDPNLVDWEGPNDPQNPKNWSAGHRWLATIIISLFTLMSPISSSMVAPALTAIDSEFHITDEVISQLVLSIFVLAYAIGPLFLGPMSEMHGRVRVIQLGNLFYFVFNLACGFAQTSAQLAVFRFLAGLGGSAPLAVGAGVLSDCWRSEQRGRAVSVYSMAPLVGPAIGPIAGGFIAENTTWRWCFWATSIATMLVQVIGIFFLQETYAPILLHRKLVKLRKETGNTELYTPFSHLTRQPVMDKLATSLKRPFIMLFTQPIIIVLALYMAYLYGTMYLVLSTFPALWTDKYHESVGIGGLNYISLGLGFFLGAQISAPMNDKVYTKLKRANGGVGKPEFRCRVMIPGAFLVPIGLFIYGWTAQYKVFWLVPNIGACLFSAGSIVCFQVIQTYIVDSYTMYAASAIAAITVLRSCAGFGFPLFAPYMYGALDYGWGNSVLAFVAIAIGIPAPLLLWRYGEYLRSKSTFAAGSSA